jgi:hypothetical protein
MKKETTKSARDLQWDILDNFKNMSEREMKEALSALCEAVKSEMIEQVQSAIYWMNDKKY